MGIPIYWGRYLYQKALSIMRHMVRHHHVAVYFAIADVRIYIAWVMMQQIKIF